MPRKSVEDYIEAVSSLVNFYMKSIDKIIEFTEYDDFARSLEQDLKKTVKFVSKWEKVKKGELPLVIAVAGRFSSGKSTLINSIMSREFLGMDVIPSTAKISKLKYGDELCIEKIYKDGSREEITEKEFQKLSVHPDDHNLSEDQKNILDDIERFDISYPIGVLKNINILDTPGILSGKDTDDELTKEGCEEADFIIWVLNVDKGGGAIPEDEYEPIKEIANGKGLFCILNKMDLKVPRLRDKDKATEDYFQERISDFQVNAWDALEKTGELHSQVEEIIPYAAKPILEYKENSSVRRKELEKITSNLKTNNGQDKNTIIEITSEGISVMIGEEIINEVKIEEEAPTDYCKYHEILKQKLKEHKENKNKYQKGKCLKEIRQIYNELEVFSKNEVINSLSEKENEYTEEFEKFKDRVDDFQEDFQKEIKERYANMCVCVFEEIKAKWFATDESYPDYLKLRSYGKRTYNTKANVEKAFAEMIKDLHDEFLGFTSHEEIDLDARIFKENLEKQKDNLVKITFDNFHGLEKILSYIYNQPIWIDSPHTDKIKEALAKLIPDKIFKQEVMDFYTLQTDNILREEKKEFKREVERINALIEELQEILL